MADGYIGLNEPWNEPYYVPEGDMFGDKPSAEDEAVGMRVALVFILKSVKEFDQHQSMGDLHETIKSECEVALGLPRKAAPTKPLPNWMDEVDASREYMRKHT
jgi:hypothetical protein